MNKLFLGIMVATSLMLAGCGKPVKSAADNSKAFDSASADIKADWEKITAAAAAKDYATAILTCKKLQMQTALTEEQRSAVVATMTAEGNQMSAEAQKGDANALKAVQDIRQRWRN